MHDANLEPGLERGRGRALALFLALAALATGAFAQGQIFTDGFESGDLSAWRNTRDPGAPTLFVTPMGALNGFWSLRAFATDRGFLVDTTPNSETVYRAGFLFHPDTLNLRRGARLTILSLLDANNREHTKLVVAPGRRKFLTFRLYTRERGTGYGLIGSGRVPRGRISRVQLEWAAAADDNDGLVRLKVNRNIVAQDTELDNSTLGVDRIRFGLIGRVPAAASGSFYLDDFASFRTLAP